MLHSWTSTLRRITTDFLHRLLWIPEQFSLLQPLRTKPNQELVGMKLWVGIQVQSFSVGTWCGSVTKAVHVVSKSLHS